MRGSLNFDIAHLLAGSLVLVSVQASFGPCVKQPTTSTRRKFGTCF